MTCTRAQEFLVRNKLEVNETVDARKTSLGSKEVLALAAQVDEIYTCKGSKVVRTNLKQDKPTPQQLQNLLLGPTGNLRAPTIRKGHSLLVGFNQEAYEQVLLKGSP
jgi:arsenate reductase-like glutaredoxin family protein